jgi:hypothetical protein
MIYINLAQLARSARGRGPPPESAADFNAFTALGVVVFAATQSVISTLHAGGRKGGEKGAGYRLLFARSYC